MNRYLLEPNSQSIDNKSWHVSTARSPIEVIAQNEKNARKLCHKHTFIAADIDNIVYSSCTNNNLVSSRELEVNVKNADETIISNKL